MLAASLPTLPSARARQLLSYVALFALSASSLRSQSLALRHETLAGPTLRAVCLSGSILVAVGDRGRIITSTDGVVWTPRAAGVTTTLRGVAAGPTGFVAVGDSGTILQSADGTRWSPATSVPTTARLNAITRAQDFFAVGDSGTILRFPDGRRWSTESSPTNHHLRAISSGSLLYAWGDAGTCLQNYRDEWQSVASPFPNDFTAIIPDISHQDILSGAVSARLYATALAGGSNGTPFTLYQEARFRRTEITEAPVARLGSIRAIAAGSPVLIGSYRGSSVFYQHSYRSPILVVDDAGRTLLAQDGVGSKFAPAIWSESLPVGPGINAAIWRSGTRSFFLVGENERILELHLTDAATPPWGLTNVSTRGSVSPAQGPLVLGVVLHGTEPRRVLVRGIGPTLSRFGVPTALANLTLGIHDADGRPVSLGDSATPFVTADLFADQATLASGAFPVADRSGDVIATPLLWPGRYTFSLASRDGAAGVALIEIYDSARPTDASSRFLNLSTRGLVTAANPLIAGINVPPGETRAILLRAIGPGLARFGLTNALSRPTLTLFRGATAVATASAIANDPSAAALNSAAAQVGAFGATPQDAALVTTLASGSWTIVVGSADASPGTALVEAYVLP
jgi:hypothetical protein